MALTTCVRLGGVILSAGRDLVTVPLSTLPADEDEAPEVSIDGGVTMVTVPELIVTVLSDFAVSCGSLLLLDCTTAGEFCKGNTPSIIC